MKFTVLFLSFIFYSMLGWLYESTICSVAVQHRFINRGFLLGPYCPVYGTGALCCYLLFAPLKNTLVIMLFSMVICSAIEYVTGYGMEKIFHAKWWDYSDLPFQLHGRICLYGALIFGVGSVLVCKVIQPLFLDFVTDIPGYYLNVAALMIEGIFLTDIIMTLASWNHLNKELDSLYQLLSEYGNESMNRLSDRLLNQGQMEALGDKLGIQLQIKNWNTKLKSYDLHFFRAFPQLMILKFENIPEKIKDDVYRILKRK